MDYRMALAAGALSLCTACNPNATGAGSGSNGATLGDGTATGTTGGEGTSDGPGATTQPPGTDDSGGPPPGTTSGPPASTDDTTDSGEEEESDGTAESSGDPACEDPDTQALWVEDGTLIKPMLYFEGSTIGIPVAYSVVEESGIVIMDFSLNCDGPLYLWGLMWDFMPGPAAAENPDSYYFSIDGGEERLWEYGCDTYSENGWQWLPVESLMAGCDHTPLVLMLDAGAHTIEFRNREAGGSSNVASIAGVALSHDPGIDPVMFLDPS